LSDRAFPAADPPPSGADVLSVRDGARPKGRKTGARKGKRGPKGSTYLTMQQVRELNDFGFSAKRAGKALNRMVTIRAPKDVPDAVGKRIISRTVAHVGQALQRRNHPHVGVTVYEKGEHLHAHHLLHVSRAKREVVDRFHDGEDVDVRPADAGAIFYVSKQRKHCQPDVERELQKRGFGWRPSARIEGPRVSFTKAARQLLDRTTSRPPAHVSASPIAAAPAPPAWPVEPDGKLVLFDLAPPMDGRITRTLREALGLPQAALGALLGVTQSALAHIENGDNGISPLHVRRLIRLAQERLGRARTDAILAGECNHILDNGRCAA
jgi:DNA-binding XRE family transcriptional regulator